MAVNTDYQVAIEITQLLCGFASDIDRWQKVIEKLRETMSAKAVQMSIVCTRNKRLIMDLNTGPCEMPLLHWVSLSETAIKDSSPLKEANHEYQSVNLSFALTEREWTNDYPVPRKVHGPTDISHAFVCASCFPKQNITAVIGVLRDSSQGEFTSENLHFLNLLQNILHNSFHCLAKDYATYATIQSMKGMINRTSLGQFIVDSTGYLLVSNQKAESILQEGKLFKVCENGSLKAFDQEIQDKLRKCVNLIAGKPEKAIHELNCSEKYIRVNMDKEKNGYLLIVSPVEGGHFGNNESTTQKLALIQVIDLADSWNVEPIALQNALDITVTEATVLKYLSEGMSLRDIATVQRRSYHTIRNHLQKVMNKTGMHRQADLMLLVHSVVLAGGAREEKELYRESS